MDSSSPFATLLIGQPTLKRKIKLGVLAALDQRISVRYHMTGMTTEETADYIRHHMTLAGRSDPLFSDDAIALIHETARGYPRSVTTSDGCPCWPPTPPARPSSTNPPPAPPSTNPPRQTEHHRASLNATTPPEHPRRRRSTPGHGQRRCHLHQHFE